MNLFTTKKKIASIGKIRKITETMKIIAISKISKAKSSVATVSDFQKELYDTISIINDNDQNKKNDKTLWIIFTTTMGMAGAFNLNTYRLANININTQDQVIVFGEKGFRYFSKKNKLLKYFKLGDKNIEFFNVKYAGDYVARLYLENKFGNVKMIYTKYSNSQPAPVVTNILPIDGTIFVKQTQANTFTFEPNKKEIMHNLTSLYVESMIYAGLVESKLSEQTSRKNAMIQANDNIDDMLGNLRIQYNKKRQEKITQEVRR